MAPKSRAPCQICLEKGSNYTCAQCRIVYCSVACYKQHKATSCDPSAKESIGHESTLQTTTTSSTSVAPTDVSVHPAQPGVPDTSLNSSSDETRLGEEINLKPLTSLKWPYVPEGSAYPDPLKRDDPKALQLPQYEAIATSSAIRDALASHPRLRSMLTAIDAQRGPDREEALQRALGVSPPEIREGASRDIAGFMHTEEDMTALRGLAEAVEAAVRGNANNILGLDWREPFE